MSITDRNRNKSVQVLERGFAILEEIARNNGEAPLAVLGKGLQIPRSTIHRILSSLMDLGYVDQNPESGWYRMGLKVLALSSVILENLDIRRVAHKYLEDLMDETGHTANLVVLDRNEVVYIAKVTGKKGSGTFSLIGTRAPVHVTGAGKVLLSELAQMDIIQMLRTKGMSKLTKYSITEIEAFLDELVKVRKQGYAFDNQECEMGARCIAVPVRDHTGRIIASVSISGAANQLKTDSTVEIAAVVKYAGRLSHALGFSPDLLKL